MADEQRIPVTARGSGTGLSGASVPRADGILVSFERMNRILEIDTDNHVAVVQPGVTLEELDRATGAHGLVYPVFPGENSASARGQRGHQRRRDARHQVRRHPAPGAGPRGGAGHRRRDPHRGEVREGVHGLRPHPAHRGIRGDAGLRDRGDAETPSAGRVRGHHPGSVRHPRSGDQSRAPDRGQRVGAAHPRVHRRTGHGGHHGQCRSRPRDPHDGAGRSRRLPGRRPGECARRPARRGHRRRWASCWSSSAPWRSTCFPPMPPDSSSAPGRRRSSWPRRPGPTTSSTRWCPVPPFPLSWPRRPRWPRPTGHSSPVAATWATATSISRSSSPTASGGTRSCTPSSGPARTSAAPSPASTGSARRRGGTSWSSRIRSRWRS